MMETLLKQVRKFSGKEEIGNSRDGIPLQQRTPSFRGEGKPQKWFKRQPSRQMSFTHSIEEAEYAAAVAAAAFAITDEDRRKPESEHRPSLSRIIGGLINPELSIEHGDLSKHYPDQGTNLTTPKKRLTFADESDEDPGNPSVYGTPLSGEDWEEPKRMKPTTAPSYTTTPTVKKTPSFSEDELEEARWVKPNYIPSFKTPTVEKTPSYEEQRMEEAKRMKSPKRPALQPTPLPISPPPAIPPLNIQPIAPPNREQRLRSQENDADVWERNEMAKIKMKSPQRPALQPTPLPIPPPPAIPPLNIQPIAPSKREQRPRSQGNDADDWERNEMAKIKQRYEKLNATILEWEDKKKKKGRRKLEMTEGGPEKKRVKAMHKYQLEMEQINQIADGARAQAKDKYRNEEMKVREKASIYRATGDAPLSPSCLCL